jgi:hypothetical protein
MNVTLAQLQLPALWWNKLLTGDVNNGLALNALSDFVGKELSSPMNFICQVESDTFNCENNKKKIGLCRLNAPESLNACRAKLMSKN